THATLIMENCVMSKLKSGYYKLVPIVGARQDISNAKLKLEPDPLPQTSGCAFSGGNTICNISQTGLATAVELVPSDGSASIIGKVTDAKVTFDGVDLSRLGKTFVIALKTSDGTVTTCSQFKYN